MSTDYEYDPDLPYVVECLGEMDARFRTYEAAEVFIAAEYRQTHAAEIIDTTPKPRVPDDAEWILWATPGERYRVARRNVEWWATRPSGVSVPLEYLSGVTPDTVFTVLEEREI